MAGKSTMEFVVAHDKSHLVREKVERISQLFGVGVSFSSPQSSAESTGVQWIRLQGAKERSEKAKEYIMSLCSPDLSTFVSVPDSVQSILYNSLNKLEYDSGAVITFASDRRVKICGSQMAVVMASSAIEDLKNRPALEIDPALKEFAMKLGYTEQDIQVVVKKHGPTVNENTLLHELIKISRTAPVLSARGVAAKQPVAEPEKFPIAKGPPQRDVVARGAPNSTSSGNVHTVTMNGNRVAYDKSVSPTPRKDAAEKAPLDKQEEQIMFQQLLGRRDAATNGDSSSGLRHIVIDGSNVAMSHGNQEVFSCFGIALCVDWFKQRGHKDITVFVPQWRKEVPKPDSPMTDQEILSDLEKERIVVFTPSRRVNGRRIVCYDDRFIIRLAAEHDGIIVSNDNYRDLVNENPKWKEVIEQRLLMFSFVNDIFMVPDDPLGRHGPTLDDFLRKGTIAHPRVCPYLGKCTFGLKCRFYHPERDPARKSESSKPSDSMANRTVAQPSYDSRRKVSVTEKPSYRPHDGAMYAGQDTRGERTFVAGGVYDCRQPAPYPDYYHQDYARQQMLPVNGVRHHPYVDPSYYGPVRQMSPYPQAQGLVHEQLTGSGADLNRQRQSEMRMNHFPDVLDAASWNKDKQDLFEQLKSIFSQSEQEDVIRRIVQNSQGKDLQTLAAEVANQVDK